MNHSHSSVAPRVAAVVTSLLLCAGAILATTLTLTDAQLVDRVKGGWLAKSAGGALGGPTEGASPNQSYTLPTLTSTSVADCNNDDDIAQVPFLNTMLKTMGGANSISTATMQDYANGWKSASNLNIVGQNVVAQDALKQGINAPYCGGWPLNGVNMIAGRDGTGEDIDYQIECQWIGFSTPGLPASALKIDSLAGHVIGYANGVYAGAFFVAASSIAPLFTDIHALVKEARKALPPQCDIRKNIDTLIWYHDNNPTKTYWDAMNWAFGSGHTIQDGDWMCRNNSTNVVIALLWGDGDIITTATDAIRLGRDTDCNCGDVCAIVGSMLGYAKLPQTWRTLWEQATSGSSQCILNGSAIAGTQWTYQMVIDSTVAVAKKAIIQAGGTYANGIYTIPVQNWPPICQVEKYGQEPAAIPCIPTSVVGGSTSINSGIAPAAAQSIGPALHVAIAARNEVSIEFTVPQGSAGKTLTIEFLNLRGQVVETAVKGTFYAGSHIVNRHFDSRLTSPSLARIRAGESQTTVMLMPK